MSVSGIEAIGGALAAMPTTPATEYLSDTQAAASGTGAAGGASFGSLLDAANGAGGATPTDAVQPTDTDAQAIAATQAQGLSAAAVPAAGAGSGTEFGSLLSQGVDRLEGLQNSSANLSVQAATGDLNAIHDYTIAAAEASTATQLTVSLKNAAVQSFQSIMNMQV